MLPQAATTPVIQRQLAAELDRLDADLARARATGDTAEVHRLIPIVQTQREALHDLGDTVIAVPGYNIQRVMPGGRSTALLLIARPTKATRRAFAARGRELGDRVVLKYIPRDALLAVTASGALGPLVRSGDILDFIPIPGMGRVFVLPHHPGQTLDMAIRDIHRQHPDGLGPEHLTVAMQYAYAVLDELARVHGIGVLHTCVHSGNIIISPDGRARLIDLDWSVAMPTGCEPARLLHARNETSDAACVIRHLLTGRIAPVLNHGAPPPRGTPIRPGWPSWIPPGLAAAVDEGVYAEHGTPEELAARLAMEYPR